MASTPPPLAPLSPLLALTLSLGLGSLYMSPEFVQSQTPMLGLPLVPLAPSNPLLSPITLSQVEDVITVSNMVQELHSCHCPLPSLFSSPTPLTLSMVVDADDDSSTLLACFKS
jgi:hypothetical protein